MRLRDQLRRLDIETEAQIIAALPREGDSNDGKFDPLELDRFSTLQQFPALSASPPPTWPACRARSTT